MAKKKQVHKNEHDDIIPQLPMVCADERTAVEFFEAQRWPNGACCPRCGSVDVVQMKDKDGNRNARYLWRCRKAGGCGRQFTVKVGTIMEDSPIPLRTWAHVTWMSASSKKGVAAKQIQRQTGLSYPTALYMMHRIRWAMVDTHGKPLTGTVQVDETFVGGKPRKVSVQQREHALRTGVPLPKRPRGRGRGHHVPVLAAYERSTGRVRTRVIADVTAATLKDAVRGMVARSAVLHTDEYAAYRSVAAHYAGHGTVNHSIGEYVSSDGKVTTNQVEGFFSRFERGIFGIWHRMSRPHLHRYATHIEWLHNQRATTDGLRTAELIRWMDGKRLTKRASVIPRIKLA